jgi:hypothetical protein
VPFVRRHLLAIAGVWLVSQISLLGVVPVLLASGHAGEHEELMCTCSTLGPGHFCPMHGMMPHHAGMASGDDEKALDCVVNTPAPVSNVSLSSLLSGLGPVPLQPGLPLGRMSAEPVDTLTPFIIFRPTRPELPPPRSGR